MTRPRFAARHGAASMRAWLHRTMHVGSPQRCLTASAPVHTARGPRSRLRRRRARPAPQRCPPPRSAAAGAPTRPPPPARPPPAAWRAPPPALRAGSCVGRAAARPTHVCAGPGAAGRDDAAGSSARFVTQVTAWCAERPQRRLPGGSASPGRALYAASLARAAASSSASPSAPCPARAPACPVRLLLAYCRQVPGRASRGSLLLCRSRRLLPGAVWYRAGASAQHGHNAPRRAQRRAMQPSCAPGAAAHRLVLRLLVGAAVEEGVRVARRQAQRLAPLPQRPPGRLEGRDIHSALCHLQRAHMCKRPRLLKQWQTAVDRCGTLRKPSPRMRCSASKLRRSCAASSLHARSRSARSASGPPRALQAHTARSIARCAAPVEVRHA